MSAPTRAHGDLLDGAFVAPSQPDGVLAPPSPADLDDVPFSAPFALAHVEAAVAGARAAQRAWERRPVEERAALLRRYAELVGARREELARAIARAIGKPLWEARTEADAMVAKVGISLTAGLELLRFSVSLDPNTRIRTRAIGTVAVIGPFNFPGHLPNGHIVPALLTGNTVVFKPSERAPEVGWWMARCFQDAGFPAGVVQVVQGDARVASRLVESEAVDAILFTGSTAVGSKILAASARFPGRMIALELGGRNPALVTADADLDHAAREIGFAAWVTAGQRCTANSRVLAHASVKDALVARLAALARGARIGAPFDEQEPFLGPVVSAESMARALRLVDEARGVFDAVAPLTAAETPKRGHYLRPGVYVHARGEARSVALGRDELFAPVVTVEAWSDEEEALCRANEGEYGLAAAVFTKERETFERFSEGLDVGLCNWNRGSVGSSSKLPFGGRKASGNHRPAGLFSSLYCVDAVGELHVPAPAPAKPGPGAWPPPFDGGSR